MQVWYITWVITLDIHTFDNTSIAINRYIIWRWLTLETYFHNDPRIEEWVDQITEKLFTVCLLTGADSEVEFQSGCQIVSKVTNILQGISMFPSEYLEDGLKQLLEQQLPDSRVINNFPTFQDNMNKMIHEGMRRALDTQNQKDLGTINMLIKDTPTLTIDVASKSSEVLCIEALDTSGDANKDEFVPDMAIPAMAPVVTTIATVVPSIPSKPYGIQRKTPVPDQADRLKQVLTNFFPNSSVCWNFNLKGQQFLAQVEDILIWVNNPEKSCPVETHNKDGWKVYECSSSDLLFPRRLERGIRQIQRLGKKCSNV